MNSRDVLAIEDSDPEEVQVVGGPSESEDLFCQICHISLTDQSTTARQAHYEQHFEEGVVSEVDTASERPSHSKTTQRRQSSSMSFMKRKVSDGKDVFWYSACGKPLPENYTPGLIPVLKQVLLRAHAQGQTVRSALCADGVVHVGSQAWDRRWGCGYRNFLMACTALMHQEAEPAYLPALMEEPCPSVHNMQRWIEDAWAAGFDEEGANDLKHKLVGTSQWIGTADIYVAFLHRGIPSRIVDFPQVDKDAEAVTKWIVKYFDAAETTTSSSVASALKLEKATVGEALRGASPVKITDRMPIILQHDGHSRTIIGYELAKNGDVNLLVLDPSKSTPREVRRSALSRLAQTHNDDSTSSPNTSRKHAISPSRIIDRIRHPLHPKNEASSSSRELKGIKRRAAESSSPGRESKSDGPSMKRVRGGVEVFDSATAVPEVIIDDDDDDDEIQCLGEGPSKPVTASNARRATAEKPLDTSAVLKHYRLKPTVVARKDKYQILYFPLDHLLTPSEKESMKKVKSETIKAAPSNRKRTFLHL